MAQELAGLQERLEAREASLAQLKTSSGSVSALKASYDRVVGELAAERDSLQKERLQLMQVCLVELVCCQVVKGQLAAAAAATAATAAAVLLN